ncbi:MAG TPA: phosphatidylserine decarboxylase [Bdellovibrionota bacterium]|nr:phosphatidylserine decarboxylase [Bdellovibrionota bacterium]
MATKVIDRKSGQIFEEKIFGEKFVRWAHETSLGLWLTSSAAIQKLTSKVYGAYASSFLSKHEISKFIEDHKIQMSDFVTPEGGFKNFNEFFSRRLAPGARSFLVSDAEVISPAEGRVFYASIVDRKSSLVIKGHAYDVGDLIGEKDIGDLGHAYVVRLCPVDYHRYHFAVSGTVLSAKDLGGKLFSVNPIALEQRHNIFWENYRKVYKVQTSHGICYQAEVGAICVGSMTETKAPGDHFVRGEEKGTFLFGGSTCLLLLPKSFVPDADIVKNSQGGYETLVRVGDTLGAFH